MKKCPSLRSPSVNSFSCIFCRTHPPSTTDICYWRISSQNSPFIKELCYRYAQELSNGPVSAFNIICTVYFLVDYLFFWEEKLKLVLADLVFSGTWHSISVADKVLLSDTCLTEINIFKSYLCENHLPAKINVFV